MTFSTLVLGAAMALTTIAGVIPADAETTTCTDALDRPHTGNLVVPEGAACQITSDVHGNVLLHSDATLLVEGATLHGSIAEAEAATNTMVGVEAGTVTGTLTLPHGSVMAAHATIAGRSSVGSPGADGYFMADTSTLGNTTQVVGLDTYVSQTTQAHGLTTLGGSLTQVYDSRLSGGITARGNRSGFTLCGTTVSGQSWLSGNGNTVIGHGTTGVCDGENQLGGLTLSYTAGTIHVSHTSVRGNLAGWNNAQLPVVGDAVTAGYTTGQFQGLADATARTRPAASTAESDLGARLRARYGARKAAALASLHG